MNWTLLAALVWLLIAIAGWILSRPSSVEKEALAKVDRSDLLRSLAGKIRGQLITPEEASLLQRFRLRVAATVFVLLLPLAFLFPSRPNENADPLLPPPPEVVDHVEPAAEKPEAKKQIVRRYYREEGADGPPIVVEEFREETLEEKRDPIRLYGTAKVSALYDNEQLLGVTITNIDEGSFWDIVGFREGDFVIEANGELMDNPNTSVAFMNSLHKAPEVNIRVRGIDDVERTLLYTAPRD